MRHLLFWMATIFALCSSAPAAIVIDDFDHADGAIDFSYLPAPQHGQLLMEDGHILGGSRLLDFTVSTTPEGSGTASVSIERGIGDLYIETASGVVTSTYVLWDGPSFVDVDLTDGGRDNWFVFELLSVDHALTLTLTVQDKFGGSSTLGRSGLDVVEEVTYLFDDFEGNADFHHVTSVRMDLNSVAALDTSLDFFGTSGPVPEPSSAIILWGLLGIAGVARITRRRAP